MKYFMPYFCSLRNVEPIAIIPASGFNVIPLFSERLFFLYVQRNITDLLAFL
jgi:hypothetical protein